MRRAFFGFLVLFFSASTTAWAQEDAHKAHQEGGNLLGWLVILIPISAFVLLIAWTLRRQKTQMIAVARSLEMGEERLRLARQQIAMQAETNRLLGQLLDSQDQGDRT
jgi:hypothetical protein